MEIIEACKTITILDLCFNIMIYSYLIVTILAIASMISSQLSEIERIENKQNNK